MRIDRPDSQSVLATPDRTEAVSDRILVWHRDDLRVRDNPALAAAAEDGDPLPVFVFDPRFYDSPRVCDGRLEFLHESLAQLDTAYGESGGGLALRHGDPRALLRELLDSDSIDRLHLNATTTAGYARERDHDIAEWDDVTVFSEDGIVREGPSRENWREQAEAYFEAEPREPPASIDGPIPSSVTIDEIEAEYDVDSSKERRFRGGCQRARARLETFVENIGDYVGGISPPAAAESETSHLSAYFALGCLSLREAAQYADEHGFGRGLELFRTRLFWNRHFTQKLADNPDATEHAINPVFRGMNRKTHDAELVEAWKRGQTGFPLVDASMRALRETGWLNFRMRAMCATFYSYVLRCWWKVGADWYYRHLVDADPAINYQQWQMQSGLVGVHPLRIYNPRKQVRENDPNGEFIRTYVPELRPFPDEHLDRPEKAPLSVQADCGVRIGEDYPYPVVDFETRRTEARTAWGDLADRAREAIADPEIRRRASFSEGRDRSASGVEDGTPPRTDEQAGLDEFGS